MEPNTTIKSSSKDEIEPVEEKPAVEQPKEDKNAGGGWGWGFSAFSVLSDLQKAAEEISRNAAEVAKTAANSISDLQHELEGSESSKDDHQEQEASDKDEESEDEDDKKRKAALEKLEKASEDTIIGQGIKAIDTSMENFASGAWQALGNAWKEGSSFVQKLENSIQQGGTAGSVAPSILETGRAFTAKGLQVLEYVGKETVDLLITESGMEVDKNGGNVTEDDQLLEDVTFDRCFYIYGGPEHLEELEALSNHYAMLFNRRKAKLSTDEKSAFDVKLKEVQQLLTLNTEKSDEKSLESEKGKNVENLSDDTYNEIKSFHGSSVTKAAEMAAGFANALAGLSSSDIALRTGGRLDSLHSESIHRLSEMCCIAVSQLVNLGKSVINNTNKTQDDDDDDDDVAKFDWPEDCIEKAKILRTKTQSMTGYVEAVAISFVTGISEVAEAYVASIKSGSEVVPEKLIEDKVKSFSEDLRVNRMTAVGKIQDGLHYLAYVVVSTSMPSVA